MATALPSNVSRAFSFTNFSANYPGQQQPGNSLDAEYDRSNQAIDGILAFLASTFNADGTLLPGVVTPANLSTNLTAQLQQISNAASIVNGQTSLAFAEYLAGPVVSGAAADALVASSPFPGNIFDAPTSLSPAGGLYSAKYWALKAATANSGSTTALFFTIASPWNGIITTNTIVDLNGKATLLPAGGSQMNLYVNGYAQQPNGMDYTYSGGVLTMAHAPFPNAPTWGFYHRPNA